MLLIVADFKSILANHRIDPNRVACAGVAGLNGYDLGNVIVMMFRDQVSDLLKFRRQGFDRANPFLAGFEFVLPRVEAGDGAGNLAAGREFLFN